MLCDSIAGRPCRTRLGNIQTLCLKGAVVRLSCDNCCRVDLLQPTRINGRWVAAWHQLMLDIIAMQHRWNLTQMILTFLLAAPKFGSAGELLSGGADFSDGAEFYFDVIYLSIVAQVGSIFSKYFWLVLLVVGFLAIDPELQCCYVHNAQSCLGLLYGFAPADGCVCILVGLIGL